MDNYQLHKIISCIGQLKHKYIGSFPADMVPPYLPLNSFCIVNIETSKDPGSHWIILANKDNVVYFGDSLGKSLSDYPYIRLWQNTSTISLVFDGDVLQTGNYCGLYCIYFAYVLYTGNFSERFLNDNFLLLFFSSYL